MVRPQKKSPSTPSPSRLNALYPSRLPAGTRWWRVGDNPTINTPEIVRELPWPVENVPITDIVEPQTEDEENEQVRRATEESIQLARAQAFCNIPPCEVRILTEEDEKKFVRRAPEKIIHVANPRLPTQTPHAYSGSSASLQPYRALPNTPSYTLHLTSERIHGSSTLLPNLPPKAQEMPTCKDTTFQYAKKGDIPRPTYNSQINNIDLNAASTSHDDGPTLPTPSDDEHDEDDIVFVSSDDED
jgi:hypothetical protein